MLKGRPIFQMSAETLAVVAVLRGVNQEISYAAIAGAVGFPITGSTRALVSARRALESQENIVFETVWRQGLRRLDDAGKVRSTARHVRSIGRTARRGTKRLGAVENFSALSNADQLQATLNATKFNFVQQTVSSKKPIAPKVQPLDVKALVPR